MLLLVGFELIKFARDVKGKSNFLTLVMTVVLSLASNMAIGFVGGIVTNALLINRKTLNQILNLRRPSQHHSRKRYAPSLLELPHFSSIVIAEEIFPGNKSAVRKTMGMHSVIE